MPMLNISRTVQLPGHFLLYAPCHCMALATYFKSTTYAPMRAGFERAIWLLELRLNHSLICEPGQFLGQAILWMLHYMTRNN